MLTVTQPDSDRTQESAVQTGALSPDSFLKLANCDLFEGEFKNRQCRPGRWWQAGRPPTTSVGLAMRNQGGTGARASSARSQSAGIAFPFHWTSDGKGDPPNLVPVTPDFDDHSRVADRFLGLMSGGGGRTCAINSIERVENHTLWMQYSLERDKNGGFEGEKFLYHGLNDDIVDQVCTKGFDTAYSSMEFNAYGAGLYFAPDPRLSDFFIRESRGRAGRKRMLLARVALGSVGVRDALPKTSQADHLAALRQPANRQPPPGKNSATSSHGIEAIVYRNYQAYPAYVITYTMGQSWGDPYADQSLRQQLVNLGSMSGNGFEHATPGASRRAGAGGGGHHGVGGRQARKPAPVPVVRPAPAPVGQLGRFGMGFKS